MSSVRTRPSKKVQRKSKATKAPKVKMGKKIDRAIEIVYALTIEAYAKVDHHGTEHDFGYAQGLTEAMSALRDVQQGRSRRFPRF